MTNEQASHSQHQLESQNTLSVPSRTLSDVSLQDGGNNHILLLLHYEEVPKNLDVPPALKVHYRVNLDTARHLYHKLGEMLDSYS